MKEKNKDINKVLVPIILDGAEEYIPAEIQIRTVAMDFWASLEHQLCYKKENISDEMKAELSECARISADLDLRMDNLRKKVVFEKAEREEN